MALCGRDWNLSVDSLIRLFVVKYFVLSMFAFQDDIIFFLSKVNYNYVNNLLNLVVTPVYFLPMLCHFLTFAIFFSCWKSPTSEN